MRKRLVVALGAVALLAAVLVVNLLRSGPATSHGSVSLARQDSVGGGDRGAPPTFVADAAPSARVPAAVESRASAPLLPDRASLSVALPAGVRAAGDVFVNLSRADGSWHAGRLLRGSATWDDLLPGDYELHVDSSGWSAPSVQIALLRATDVELVPHNKLDGVVVESRSRRPPEGAGLQIEARLADGDEGMSGRNLFSQPMPLPDGTFSIAGLGLAPDVKAVRVRVSIAADVDVVSDWLPVAPRPFWSGLVLEVPDLVVRGHVRSSEAPHVPIPAAEVVLVSADVSLADVRFGDGELFLAPMQPGGPVRPLLAHTIADDDGAFALRSVSPATSARVLAWERGRMPALSAPFTLPSGAAPAEVNLDLVRGGMVHVVVHVPSQPGVDGEDPQLDLRPVRVALEAGEGSGIPGTGPLTRQLWPASSDTPGEAAFEAVFQGVSAGDYLVSALLVASGPDGASRTLRQKVAMPQCREVLAEMRPDDVPSGVHVRGRVLLPEDFAIAESDVCLVRPGAPIDGATLPQCLAAVRPDGTFDLPDALPGEQVLSVHARSPERDKLAFATSPVSVGTTDVTDLQVDLTAPEVRVRAAVDLRGQSIVLTSVTGSAELDALLNLGHIALVVPDYPGAEAHILGLRPGRYALAPRKDPGRRTEFEVATGQASITVDVR